MKLSNPYKKSSARIEMVPIWDVVFLLLVFFIYSFLTMSLQKGVRVNLPRGVGDVTLSTKTQIIIDADNNLYLNNTRYKLEGLIDTVVSRLGRERQLVLVRVDRDASAGIAIEILSKLRMRGVRDVSFQLRRGPKPTNQTSTQLHRTTRFASTTSTRRDLIWCNDP